jgi:hypothetical protein
MLKQVQVNFASGSYKTIVECFKSYLRSMKYFPYLQIKPVYKSDGLILLHNTYDARDSLEVEHFRKLHDGVRGMVVDLSMLETESKGIVVSLSDKTPVRISVTDFKAISISKSKVFSYQKGYEGTMIYIYFHKGVWYFGTSTIPNIDYSRFFHDTKTHGDMLNEILANYYPDVPVGELRTKFCENLEAGKAYGFLLVHHENSHVMNYTEEFGEKYGVLFHTFTRDNKVFSHMINYTDTTHYISGLCDIGVKYPVLIDDNVDVDAMMAGQNIYAVMAAEMVCGPDDANGFFKYECTNNVYKICREEIITIENQDRGNSNVWMNMICVYNENKPDFKVNDYLIKFHAEKKESFTLTDESNRKYDPTYVIHEAIRVICKNLYNSYLDTTYYNKHTGRYNITIEIDRALAPIMRFHMVQLRNIQTTSHKHALLTPKTIRDYVCRHNPIKNIRLLINHFAAVYKVNPHTANNRPTKCFVFLSELLAA